LILLVPYSYLCFFLTIGAIKDTDKNSGSVTKNPSVTVQLPIYNERFIIHRLLKAVSNLEWPKSKLEILVLDDSKDETTNLVDNEISRYRSIGFNIRAVKRADRRGFKAGALQNALNHSHGEYIVILDADCIPPEDFLENTVPYLESDPELGFVQTRLGYHNRNFNKITEVVAIALDCHYVIEQPARQNLSLISNFDGSAGIIRKEALIDIGGWLHYTLTEDMDLSYRMAIHGWKSKYVKDVIVGSEIPSTLEDFSNQQSRWATGCTQAARKLLKPIWLSNRLSFTQKLESTVHLTNYFVFPAMTLSFILLILLSFVAFDPKPIFYSSFGFVSMVGSFGVSIMYVSSLRFAGQRILEKIPYLGIIGAIGVGLSPILSIAVVKGLFSDKHEFITTPKYNIDNDLNPTHIVLKKHSKSKTFIEAVFIVIASIGIIYSIINKIHVVTPSFVIQLLCYLITLYYLRE